jgi:large subunit ribosomal protein L25
MNIKLKVETRIRKEKLNKDFFPGVIYGPGSENVLIKIKTNDFVKVFDQAGESNLIELEIEGSGKIQVLVKDFQKDPIKGFFNHVDFYQVDMSKKVTAEIPLEFIGESRAVKELGALLMKNIDSLEVECLPRDLVDHIDVDISSLIAFGDIIQVKDIKISSSLRVLNNLDDAVVSVVEPKKDREDASPAVEVPEAKDAKDAKDAKSKDNKSEEKKS